jgi:hypothetical protein
MKRFIGVILCVSVLMIACNKKQTETTQKDFPKTMYVNVKKGIGVRDAPYLNKQEYSLISYLAEVTVIKEDYDTMDILGVDGEWISGKWVYIIEPINGWVFDGFLSTYINIINQIKEKIIGNWIFYGFFCTFYSNGEFKGALLETSSSASGYWELKDDKIIINITKRMENYAEWNVNEKEEYKYSFNLNGLALETTVKGNDISKNSGGENIEFLSFLPKLSTRENNNIVMTFLKFGEGRDIFDDYQLHADYVWEIYKIFFNRFQEDLTKVMYVNATEGLRVINSPSSDGEKIGLLDYLTEVRVTKEDNNTVNIGGIDGKWVYITEPIEGWVFGGFLEDYDQYTKRIDTIKEKFIGNWICYNYNNYNGLHTFYSNGKFYGGSLESAYYTSGYWVLKDDKVIINITSGEVNNRNEYKYSFIDDTMILTHVEENVRRIFVKFGEKKYSWQLSD